MIEKIITDGINKAVCRFDDKKGTVVKFSENAEPKFVLKVGQVVDEFIYGDKDSIDTFIDDIFKKSPSHKSYIDNSFTKSWLKEMITKIGKVIFTNKKNYK